MQKWQPRRDPLPMDTREKSLNVGYGGETCNLNKTTAQFLCMAMCIYAFAKRNCSGSPWLDDAYQLSPAKVKRDDVTFGDGEMLLDYQNSMEVKEELSGCDVSPHSMKPIFLASCLQPRWFTHRCICWILIPTTTTKTLNCVFVEIPLQRTQVIRHT